MYARTVVNIHCGHQPKQATCPPSIHTVTTYTIAVNSNLNEGLSHQSVLSNLTSTSQHTNSIAKGPTTTATRSRLCTHFLPKPPKLAPNGPSPQKKLRKDLTLSPCNYYATHFLSPLPQRAKRKCMPTPCCQKSLKSATLVEKVIIITSREENEFSPKSLEY